jgi:glycosyltransferase involved in cell wall biosynthesis
MRILFICHEYPPKPFGGIGSFTKLMAEKMTEKGISVGVIGYGQMNANLITEECGVKVYRVATPTLSKNKYFNVIKQLCDRLKFHFTLQRHIKAFQPDLIETYEWTGPLLLKSKGVKNIVRLHGSNTANNEYMGLEKNAILKFYEKRTIRIADHILSVSNHIANITQQSFQEKFTFQTIYNGVDLNIFSPETVERDLTKIILVGRMHPYKGFDELFASMNHLFALNDQVNFEIICTIIENYKERLLDKVDLRHHHRISFIGRVPNNELKKHYSAANLSILPSLSEAFPIIPLESMACETPVIISNRFSSMEIITNGEDGFLVDIMEPKKLAEQIALILADQDKIESMRKMARNKIALNFNIDQIIATNIQFYESILYNA